MLSRPAQVFKAVLLCLCTTSIPLPGSCCFGQEHPLGDEAFSKWTVNTPLFTEHKGTQTERLISSAKVTACRVGVRWQEQGSPHWPPPARLASARLPESLAAFHISPVKQDRQPLGASSGLGHPAFATSTSLLEGEQNTSVGHTTAPAGFRCWLINELLELCTAPR